MNHAVKRNANRTVSRNHATYRAVRRRQERRRSLLDAIVSVMFPDEHVAAVWHRVLTFVGGTLLAGSAVFVLAAVVMMLRGAGYLRSASHDLGVASTYLLCAIICYVVALLADRRCAGIADARKRAELRQRRAARQIRRTL